MIDCLVVIAYMIVFLFWNLMKYGQKAYMQGQVMSSSMTTEVLIYNEKAKDEALDFTASPWCWRYELFACLSVWLF
jgi:hypothetical protein